MKTHPLSIGTLHIIGIGGIGMSSLAEVLHRSGHSVQGSDRADNKNIERLRHLGVPVFIGTDPKNVEGATTVVRSSDVPLNNPEVVAARKKGIAVLSRAELLSEIMRYTSAIAISGTHGKTTTTSLMATMMIEAGLDPTVLSGGILVDLLSNARAGAGNWMVVEADESDQTFIQIPATIAVITNIEPEHLNNYGSFAKLKEAFIKFANDVPFYGFSVVCLDHPVVKEILPKITKPHITYGTHKKADCRATNIKHTSTGMSFDVHFDNYDIKDVQLALHGRHNVLNALAVIVVAIKMGVFPSIIKHTLASFSGVQRRFTTVAEVEGVTIVDDYGHHPTEIAAVLTAAQKLTKHKVIAVVQPHRYSRLHDLFKEFATCFSNADTVILAPVYAAGEKPIPNATHTALAAEVHKHFKGKVYTINAEEELAPLLKTIVHKGDYVILLGAGSISQWAHNLPKSLEPLLKHSWKKIS
ncbi:MAG: UDP-N-acetylmuramate--L-alanine ligase [Alphaproteobacteria bacterium RIFCSPHIGHO2_01_FULL_41_14]|nr:MAG: UDP-N-acetylmuramate--L-alanine ligase [Alphaproteobacteria bacterium GWA1_45_9]OFW89691.1 MAG: UDP-N-acetylmuramate--L-alanine ligase [Alphaproteobacteria bacterium RIFCSPHIGHO2_01_FULL_41_14]HCI49134.1 UDP-N-acetylmuramate--L-alanine ligase [Holosporales bacterium]